MLYIEDIIPIVGIIIGLAGLITIAVILPAIRRAVERERFSASNTGYVRGVLEISDRLLGKWGEPHYETILQAKTDSKGNAGIILLDENAFTFSYSPKTTHIEYVRNSRPRKVKFTKIHYYNEKGNFFFLTIRANRKLRQFLRDTDFQTTPPTGRQDSVHVHICGKDFWIVKKKEEKENGGSPDDILFESIVKNIKKNEIAS